MFETTDQTNSRSNVINSINSRKLAVLSNLSADHESRVILPKLLNKFRVKAPIYLLPLLFLLVTYFSGVTPPNVHAGTSSADTSCIECHSDMIDASINKPYVHMPFLKQQCSLCHVDNRATKADEHAAAEEEKYSSITKKINWLDYRYSPATQHSFIIPTGLLKDDNMIVAARDPYGKLHEEKLSLPAIESLPVIENDGQPNIITSSEIIGVYGGIMISAHIGWLTNKKSDSEIRYGIDTLRYSVKADELIIDHEIVLQGLKANKMYQYKIISRDIFGNSAVSETGSFSTASLSPLPPSRYENQQKIETQLNAQFFRNEDSYLVICSTNQPVTLKIGNEAVNKEEEKFPETVPEVVAANYPDHLPLRSSDEISISVCKMCHVEMFTTGNHAVNVGSSQGVIIPAGYATNSDGHITCITCHSPHASNFKYITAKSSKRELCVGCHKDKGFDLEDKGHDLIPGERSKSLLLAQQELESDVYLQDKALESNEKRIIISSR